MTALEYGWHEKNSHRAWAGDMARRLDGWYEKSAESKTTLRLILLPAIKVK